MANINASALNSLQTRINAERSRRSLSPVTFTDGALSAGGTIKATHFAELRTYTAGLNTLGSQTFNWSGTVSVGASITDVITQISNFVTTLEGEALASWKNLSVSSFGTYSRNGLPVYFEIYHTTANMRSNNQFRFITKQAVQTDLFPNGVGGNLWVARTTHTAVNWSYAGGGGTGWYGQWRANNTNPSYSAGGSQIEYAPNNQNPNFTYFNDQQDVYHTVDTKNDSAYDQALQDEGGNVYTAPSMENNIYIPPNVIVPSTGNFNSHNHIVASSSWWGSLPSNGVPSKYLDIQAYY